MSFKGSYQCFSIWFFFDLFINISNVLVFQIAYATKINMRGPKAKNAKKFLILSDKQDKTTAKLTM